MKWHLDLLIKTCGKQLKLLFRENEYSEMYNWKKWKVQQNVKLTSQNFRQVKPSYDYGSRR